MRCDFTKLQTNIFQELRFLMSSFTSGSSIKSCRILGVTSLALILIQYPIVQIALHNSRIKSLESLWILRKDTKILSNLRLVILSPTSGLLVIPMCVTALHTSMITFLLLLWDNAVMNSASSVPLDKNSLAALVSSEFFSFVTSWHPLI